jgi:hypothetical protein
MMAALSVITRPSGSSRVGTCPSGLSASSRSRCGPGSTYGIISTSCGSFDSASAASTIMEPQLLEAIRW